MLQKSGEKWVNSTKKLQYKQTCQVFRFGRNMPPDPQQGVQKIFLAPAWLEKFLDHNQENFL